MKLLPPQPNGLALTLAQIAWCLAMLGVTALALLPLGHLQLPIFNWWDKAQHALAFAVLTGWALWLWPEAAWRVAVGMLAYGAGIELAQWAVGWRFAEWADWAADAVGVVGAWILRSHRRMTEDGVGG